MKRRPIRVKNRKRALRRQRLRASQPVPPSLRILLADDDPLLQRAFCRAANQRGDELIQETSGLDAVQRAVETQPDLIVLDLGFADADGRDVLAQLKADQRTTRIPVVVWSAGRAHPEADRRVVLDLGAEAYVEKGDPGLLLVKLDRVFLSQTAERV